MRKALLGAAVAVVAILSALGTAKAQEGCAPAEVVMDNLRIGLIELAVQGIVAEMRTIEGEEATRFMTAAGAPEPKLYGSVILFIRPEGVIIFPVQDGAVCIRAQIDHDGYDNLVDEMRSV